ncbi:MAG: aminotransferase class I/II-fold pyridoxal phosphate-dependent enzyme, partial [Myxococcota bacterium]
MNSPPLAPYIREHFARAAETFHASLRPEGYIPLCIAENHRRTDVLLALLHGYLDRVDPSTLGYDAMVGNVGFRENLAAYLSRAMFGRKFTADQLVVLAGAGTVLEQLFFAIADPGDTVLVPTPSYAGFWADLETRDELRIQTFARSAADDYALTEEILDRAWNEATSPVRALLFTSPDN